MEKKIKHQSFTLRHLIPTGLDKPRSGWLFDRKTLKTDLSGEPELKLNTVEQDQNTKVSHVDTWFKQDLTELPLTSNKLRDGWLFYRKTLTAEFSGVS